MLQFRVERKILKLLGATIRTYDQQRNLVARADQKAFKLKEQIVFYSDDQKTQPMFSIKARKVLDISATYDIFAPDGVTVVASMQREGLASMFVRDQWKILNAQGEQIGRVQEDTELLGVLRRQFGLIALIFPQKYTIYAGEQALGNMLQNRNPFTLRYDVTYNDGADTLLGSALIHAIPNLIAVIEGKQS